MTKNKLDQLFETRLKELEIEPSTGAFAKFERQLEGKKGKPIWYYVAAAISILFVISGLYWTNLPSEPNDIIALEAKEISPVKKETMPAPITQSEVAQIIKEKAEVQEKELIENKILANSNKTTSPPEIDRVEEGLLAEVEEKTSSDEEVRNENSEPIINTNLELETSPSIATIATNDIPEEEKVVRTLPKVKITYISGRNKKNTLLAKSNVESDSSEVKDGALNKIWNSARNLANGTLIADLRDVKENFFNKNND